MALWICPILWNPCWKSIIFRVGKILKVTGENFLRRPLCHLLRSRMFFWSLIFMFWTYWNMFETFSTMLGRQNRFFISRFCKICWQHEQNRMFLKAFMRKMLIKVLKTPNFSHFVDKSCKIWQWKINFNNPKFLKMSQTYSNRSRTSKVMIRNIFWTSISDISVTFSTGRFLSLLLTRSYTPQRRLSDIHCLISPQLLAVVSLENRKLSV